MDFHESSVLPIIVIKVKNLQKSLRFLELQGCPVSVLNLRKSIDALVIISIVEIKFVSILFPHCKLFVILMFR